MERFSRNELAKVTRLIKKGLSLNKISSISGRSKTSIYYHFRKIKGKIVQPVAVNYSNDELIGEFMGLFAGDGCINVTRDFKYRVFLCFNYKTEQQLAYNTIQNLLIPLFGKKPMIFTRKTSNFNLCYYSKNICQFIKEYLTWNESSRKTYTVSLRTRKHSDKFAIGFLRGSIDSDGHISKHNISFASVSKQLIEDISSFLSRFSIKHNIRTYKEKRANRKDIQHITVSWTDHDRFLNLVEPRKLKAHAPTGIRTQMISLEG